MNNKWDKFNQVAKIMSVEEEKKEEIKEEKKEEHDPSTFIFITVILIIIAAFLFFLVYIYEPNNYHGLPSNHKTTTTTNNYYFNVIKISEEDINMETSIDIENYNIQLISNNNKFDILVNNTKIGTFNKLASRVSIIDDILFVYLKNDEPRQNKLIGIKNNEIIYELYNIENVGGMVIEDVVFNPDSINIITSRIYKDQLILSSNYGDVLGSNICNSKDIKNILISANYELKYEGNNKFKDLVKIYGTYLDEYINKNNLCK